MCSSDLPGSILDTLTRVIADGLQRKWGQSVVVENIAGSGGNAGTERFSRSAPDGYTLLSAPPGPMTVNKLLFRDIGYDAATFAPIAITGKVPNALTVRKDFPASDFPGYVEYARKNPGKVSYGSQGAGSTPFFVAKMLEQRAGVEMLHVPYRGSALAQNDISAGVLDSFFDAISNALPLARGGNARILAITDTERSPLAPDAPTVASYYPGFRSISWFAFAAPPGTNQSLVDRISADIALVLSEPATKARLTEIGLTPVGSRPPEAARFIREEDEMWSQLIRTLKLEPQ